MHTRTLHLVPRIVQYTRVIPGAVCVFWRVLAFLGNIIQKVICTARENDKTTGSKIEC